MKRKPARNNSELLDGQRASQKLAVNRNGRLILTIIDMNMRLMMLLVIHVNHLNYNAKKTTDLRHGISLLFV